MSLNIRVAPLWAAVTVFGALTTACTRESASPAQRVQHDSVIAAPDTTTFENHVWKVSRSATVEVGQLYVFLSDGTLLIASAHGTPSLASWRRSASGMTMVEEGIPYDVTILHSSADSLGIRMANPGEPVTMELVRASIGGGARR